MTIPEIEEALKRQQAEFAKLIAESRQIVENIKELRHQIGVPSPNPEANPQSIFDPLSAARRLYRQPEATE